MFMVDPNKFLYTKTTNNNKNIITSYPFQVSLYKKPIQINVKLVMCPVVCTVNVLVCFSGQVCTCRQSRVCQGKSCLLT